MSLKIDPKYLNKFSNQILAHKSFQLNIPITKNLNKSECCLFYSYISNLLKQSKLYLNWENYMQNLLQRDLGSILLSIAVLLGWLGLFFVFLRVLTIGIKKILEAIFKKT